MPVLGPALFMLILIAILGVIGHVVLWVMLINRVHGLGVNRLWIELLTYLCIVAFLLLAIGVAAALWLGADAQPSATWRMATLGAWTYLTFCTFVLAAAIVQRIRLKLHPERSSGVLSNHTTCLDLSDEADTSLPGILKKIGRLPGNEVLKLHQHEVKLTIPRLAQQHAGIRVAQISDLHMSGRIEKRYFERIADEVNLWGADIVAVTGDLVDSEACIDWLPDTLGRLQAEFGVYYVLGNHDRRVDFDRVNQVLTDEGLVHLGGVRREIRVRDVPVILAGNELPWFQPAPDMSQCPPHADDGLPLRILVSHSPDQFKWAQEQDFDLMLAGHTHGGQVRLPLIGPILAPSRLGVRYSSGTFSMGNTVMHVSRGTASHFPLRYNCPPEMSELTLCAGS